MYDKRAMQKYQKRYWKNKSQKERRNIAQKINEHKKQQRKLTKIKAVELKGGKCIRCGYNKCIAALVFHHRNPDEKDKDTYKVKESLWVRPWEFILQEIEKCDLLCANCHHEIHYRDS